jgi:patatin-like phospholipase/acyl hydrolase
MIKSAGDRFQILCLDGGGLKGIFAAAILAAIEEDLNTTAIDHFDLIAGTSTGGILAIGLGLGLRPREILDFYVNEGKTIFSDRFRKASLQQYGTNKFPAAPLATALKKHFKEKRFGDSTKRLLVPAYNLGENDLYIFRTAHCENLKRDYKVPAWKVALSTSAAPTYFPCAREIDSLRLIDGGVWANNPSMVAITEAYGPLGIPLSDIRVLSIGTLNEVTDYHKSLDRGGFWQWRNAAVDVIMNGQSIAAANQARFFIGRDNYLRLNTDIPAGTLKLDTTTRSADLVAKAHHYSRSSMPEIEKHIKGHLAPKFEPVYK